MKNIILGSAMIIGLLAAQTASAASSPVALTDDLGQILAPISSVSQLFTPSVTPVAQTGTSTSVTPDLGTTVMQTTPAATTTTPITAINAVDMSGSYLTLTPLKYTSSYSYPSMKLSATVTKRLYLTGAGLLGLGLLFASGLIERAQAINLGRMPQKAAVTPEKLV